MVAKYFINLLVLLFIYNVSSYSVHVKMRENNVTDDNETSHLKNNKTDDNAMKDMKYNETDVDERAHLKYESVLRACNNSRDKICSSNDTHICTMRRHKNNTQYKDFKNACYLFMSNMCDYPGEEFLIIRSGTCDEYLLSRRNDNIEGNDTHHVENHVNGTNSSGIDFPNILREDDDDYVLKQSHDDHPCPISCPNIYNPTCINANRYSAHDYKLLVFANHCESDKYYCEHWQEFETKDPESRSILVSGTSWSYCGTTKYVDFARFAEVSSSLGHYGWLAGDYKPTHIMKPHERMPGYG